MPQKLSSTLSHSQFVRSSYLTCFILYLISLCLYVSTSNGEIYWDKCDFEVDPNERPGLNEGDFYDLCIQEEEFDSVSQAWKFTKATIQNTLFSNCVFTNEPLNPNNFTGATWENVEFDSCSFGTIDPTYNKDIIFHDTSLTNVKFSNCVFDRSINLIFRQFSMTNVSFENCSFRSNVLFELGQLNGVQIANSNIRFSDEFNMVTYKDESITFRMVTITGLTLLENEFLYPLRFEGVNAANLAINQSTLSSVECDSLDRYLDEDDEVSVLRSSFNDSVLFDLNVYDTFRCPSTTWRRPIFSNITFYNDVDLSQSQLTDFIIDTISQKQRYPDEGKLCHTFNFSNSILERKLLANVTIDCEADFQSTSFEQVRVKNLFIDTPMFDNAVFKEQEYIDGICCSVACKPLNCLCDVPTPSGSCPSGDKSVNVSKNARSSGGAACFPANAEVNIINYNKKQGKIKMHELQRSQEVVLPSMINSRQAVSSSQVFFFSHKNQNDWLEYLHIMFENEGSLRISEGHYLYVNGQLRVARRVAIGDKLRSGVDGRDNVKVKEIRKVMLRGIFAPMTTQGEMIVDGVVVSCYTEAVDSKWAAKMLWPLRLAHKMGLNSVIDSVQNLFEKDSLEPFARYLHLPKGDEVLQN